MIDLFSQAKPIGSSIRKAGDFFENLLDSIVGLQFHALWATVESITIQGASILRDSEEEITS